MRSRGDLVRRGCAVALATLAISAFSSTATAGAQDEVVKGAATATADSVGVELSSSGVTLGFTVGRSTARYQDLAADAEGRALDLGTLRTLLAQPQCTYPPVLNVDTLPPKTVADSSVAGADRSQRTEVKTPGLTGQPAGLVLGTQDATATPLPSSQALTETVDSDLGLIALDGASTHTEAKFEANVRFAHAISSARQLRVLGGVLAFTNPRWEATARSGATTDQTATFDFDSATLFGLPRTHDEAVKDLDGLKANLEQSLSALGLTFQLPTVEHTADDMGISISPMGFLIDHPPIGKDIVFPFLNSDMVKEQQKRDIDADCRNKIGWTTITALRGVFGGTGQIRFLVGGAGASTDQNDYSVQVEAQPAPGPDTEAPTIVADAPPDTAPAPSADTDGTSTDLGGIDYTTGTTGYSDSPSSYDTATGDLTTDTTPVEEFSGS